MPPKLIPRYRPPRDRLRQCPQTAAVLLATGFSGASGASWWLYLARIIVSDVAIIGYLRGPRMGALAFSTMHTHIAPFVLAGVGLAANHSIRISVATIQVG